MIENTAYLLENLFGTDRIEDVSIDQLKELVDEYPAFNAGHYFLSRKLQLEDTEKFQEETQLTALYFNNPFWLQWLLLHGDGDTDSGVQDYSSAQSPEIVNRFHDEDFPTSIPEPVESPAEIHEEKEEIPVVEEMQELVAEPEAAEMPQATIATFQENREFEAARIEEKPLQEDQTTQETVAEEPKKSVIEFWHDEAPEETVVEQSISDQPTANESFHQTVGVEYENPVQEEYRVEETTVDAYHDAALIENTVNSEIISETPVLVNDKVMPQPEEDTAAVHEDYDSTTYDAVNQESISTDQEIRVDNTDQPKEEIADFASDYTVDEEQQVQLTFIPPAENRKQEESVDTEESPPGEDNLIEVSTPQEVTAEKEEEFAAPQILEVSAAPAINPTEEISGIPENYSSPNTEEKMQEDTELNELAFEPYHTIDYFASQGIRFLQEENPTDRFGKQLKSFTDWLKAMKKLPQLPLPVERNEVEEAKIEKIAASSIEEKDVVTEAMAEVLAKQGLIQNAIETYLKLSLLNPFKIAYFAAKIEELKKNNSL